MYCFFYLFFYNEPAFFHERACRIAHKKTIDGAMADRLCRGLQSSVVRFDSGWCLQVYINNIKLQLLYNWSFIYFKANDNRLCSFSFQERTNRKGTITVISVATRITPFSMEIHVLCTASVVKRRRQESGKNPHVLELASPRIAVPCKWYIQSFCLFYAVSRYGIYHLEKFFARWRIFASMCDFFLCS